MYRADKLQFIHDTDTHIQIFEPFLLLGLLANYNRFEFQNPYHLRLVDFVNEATIQKIVKGVGVSCAALRNGYVAVQDDVPEGWTLTSTLIFFGLRALAPGAKDRATPPTPEEAKEMFAALYEDLLLNPMNRCRLIRLQTSARGSDSSSYI